MGEASGIAVGSSVTTVPMALADIVRAPDSVNVHESMDAIRVYIACGDIGGAMVGDIGGAGLAEQNGSGLSGIAWLHDKR